ncbi:SLATT domain-containing protein [Halomonas sp. ZH2S]|uniref:SLATT domain-containing protein n=1 Tax=Vreelandella zhuhanensis TaxID=2684210 RepID=A0A7X3KRG0_9GAMM|nr:SLATT domain-containing protein [Halomonas zhuhanensis]MWJ27972.1 SLATT domain-containing protein [Halomonas zhuhanensis]
MEQNSPHNALEDQIRECYGRVAWSHKTHEKCSDILNTRLNRIKLWQIILSAITTTGIMVAVFGESKEIGIVSAVLSFFLTVLSTYVKQYDLGGLAQKHADAAVDLWSIRECYLSLLTDIRSGHLEDGKVRELRDALQERLSEIYRGSPRTIAKAYKEATKALKQLEELTFSDEEIDAILPKPLRKTSNNGL